jgi:hypothetical protein
MFIKIQVLVLVIIRALLWRRLNMSESAFATSPKLRNTGVGMVSVGQTDYLESGPSSCALRTPPRH